MCVSPGRSCVRYSGMGGAVKRYESSGGFLLYFFLTAVKEDRNPLKYGRTLSK